jgi:hypothetical protein
MKSGGNASEVPLTGAAFFIERTKMSANNQTATGPRTDAGKAVSSMNSLKHGLTARTVVLRGENQADFDRLHEQLLAEHAPAGTLETELVAEIAACLWRLQRARRYESTVLETSSFELFVSHTQAKGFETLLRYMGAIERQLNRAIVRLRESQAERRKSAAPQRLKVMSASSYAPAQFVSSPHPQPVSELTTDHRPLTTISTVPQPGAELATSH